MTKLTYQLTLAIAAIAAATVVWASQDGKECEGKCEGTATVATSTDASAACCKGKCEGTATVATSTDASSPCSKGKCEGTATVATSTDASSPCSKGKCEGTATVATSTDASSPCSKGKCEGTATVATSTDASPACCKGKCEGTATVATSTDASAECCKGKCEGTATVATSTDASAECCKGKCEGTATVATSTDASAPCCKGKCEATATVATSTDASAECCKGKCEGAATVATSTTAKSEGCPIAAAMENLPKMTFAVGDEKTCCPETAKKLAEEAGTKFQFVVAGKTYADKADAMTALVDQTETFVTAFTQPTTCQVSGTTTVAGKAHSCSVAAGQTAALAQEAMKKVQLTYLVGETECHCPVEAKQAAEETGKQTLFVVGQEKTACNVTARLNLAHAKYKAAITAIAKANSEEKPATDES